jgi:hypothetical protein
MRETDPRHDGNRRHHAGKAMVRVTLRDGSASNHAKFHPTMRL